MLIVELDLVLDVIIIEMGMFIEEIGNKIINRVMDNYIIIKLNRFIKVILRIIFKRVKVLFNMKMDLDLRVYFVKE